MSKIESIQWTENSMAKHELSVWYRVGFISEMSTAKYSVFSFEHGSCLLECTLFRFFYDMWSFWKKFWGRLVPTNACNYLNNILTEVSGGCTQLRSLILCKVVILLVLNILRLSVWSTLLLIFYFAIFLLSWLIRVSHITDHFSLWFYHRFYAVTVEKH